MLPLPPGRSVEAPQAADDPDLGSIRGKPRVVILEESDLVPVGETGDVRWMIVGILVVPEDGRDGGLDAVPEGPEDGVVGFQVIAVRRVPREQEQVDRPEAIEVGGDGPEIFATVDVPDRRDAHFRRRTRAISMKLSGPSELADDRLAGREVDDREACRSRLDVSHLLVGSLRLPRRRVDEAAASVLIDAA